MGEIIYLHPVPVPAGHPSNTSIASHLLRVQYDWTLKSINKKQTPFTSGDDWTGCLGIAVPPIPR